MKQLIILLAVLFIGCKDCPEKIVYKTKIVRDTIVVIKPPPPDEVCPVCLEAYKDYTTYYWDSVKSVYYTELEKKITQFEYWRDSSENALNQKYIRKSEELRLYALKLDSIKNLKVFDNMIIYADTSQIVRAEFDSTGKPVLIFE
jgi:hypothetical protein